MSIIGVGCDIVNIDRILEICKKYGDRLMLKILSNREITLIPKHLSYSENLTDNDIYQFASYLGKRFAAKEAFFKALGHSLDLNFTDIEILKDSHGRPYFMVDKLNGNYSYHLSISDDIPFAIAYAIICTI